ncbi:MAG: RdgB/HAM1 family non-canonical purine NTP pyrophosphatase [Candidatus Cloacimonadaceae bacterium]|nr:RdgB/HAM1 family non-canonical purine NTP pyrophosphatase [Candidatus Cloacimonadaceae bacterium]MDP3114419.1 RdgB/HAM1 family non-canonical purine NTP pyrophosphatase [Candidatus Cloacimonadaceae bacterium]
MQKLLIASHNRDKVKEIADLLAGLPLEVLCTDDFPHLKPTVEDQDTIAGNAMKKALETAQQTGLMTLADDTGLFVHALNDEPGIFAARYAGEDCSYRDNRLKVLGNMEGKADRRATFKTCAALADPDGVIAIKEGCVEGYITDAERGENGFGYDAVFEVKSTGKTYAEMSHCEKNRLSHRALAVQKIIPVISHVIGENT